MDGCTYQSSPQHYSAGQVYLGFLKITGGKITSAHEAVADRLNEGSLSEQELINNRYMRQELETDKKDQECKRRELLNRAYAKDQESKLRGAEASPTAVALPFMFHKVPTGPMNLEVPSASDDWAREALQSLGIKNERSYTATDTENMETDEVLAGVSQKLNAEVDKSVSSSEGRSLQKGGVPPSLLPQALPRLYSTTRPGDSSQQSRRYGTRPGAGLCGYTTSAAYGDPHYSTWLPKTIQSAEQRQPSVFLSATSPEVSEQTLQDAGFIGHWPVQIPKPLQHHEADNDRAASQSTSFQQKGPAFPQRPITEDKSSPICAQNCRKQPETGVTINHDPGNELTAPFNIHNSQARGILALQDYHLELMALERKNKERLLKARREQDAACQGPDGQLTINSTSPPQQHPQGTKPILVGTYSTFQPSYLQNQPSLVTPVTLQLPQQKRPYQPPKPVLQATQWCPQPIHSQQLPGPKLPFQKANPQRVIPMLPRVQQLPQQANLQPKAKNPLLVTQQQRQWLQARTQRNFQDLLITVAQNYGCDPATVPQPERLMCEQRARRDAMENIAVDRIEKWGPYCEDPARAARDLETLQNEVRTIGKATQIQFMHCGGEGKQSDGVTAKNSPFERRGGLVNVSSAPPGLSSSMSSQLAQKPLSSQPDFPRSDWQELQKQQRQSQQAYQPRVVKTELHDHDLSGLLRGTAMRNDITSQPRSLRTYSHQLHNLTGITTMALRPMLDPGTGSKSQSRNLGQPEGYAHLESERTREPRQHRPRSKAEPNRRTDESKLDSYKKMATSAFAQDRERREKKNFDLSRALEGSFRVEQEKLLASAEAYVRYMNYPGLCDTVNRLRDRQRRIFDDAVAKEEQGDGERGMRGGEDEDFITIKEEEEDRGEERKRERNELGRVPSFEEGEEGEGEESIEEETSTRGQLAKPHNPSIALIHEGSTHSDSRKNNEVKPPTPAPQTEPFLPQEQSRTWTYRHCAHSLKETARFLLYRDAHVYLRRAAPSVSVVAHHLRTLELVDIEYVENVTGLCLERFKPHQSRLWTFREGMQDVAITASFLDARDGYVSLRRRCDVGLSFFHRRAVDFEARDQRYIAGSLKADEGRGGVDMAKVDSSEEGVMEVVEDLAASRVGEGDGEGRVGNGEGEGRAHVSEDDMEWESVDGEEGGVDVEEQSEGGESWFEVDEVMGMEEGKGREGMGY